jgi:hypothetical protein
MLNHDEPGRAIVFTPLVASLAEMKRHRGMVLVFSDYVDVLTALIEAHRAVKPWR